MKQNYRRQLQRNTDQMPSIILHVIAKHLQDEGGGCFWHPTDDKSGGNWDVVCDHTPDV